MRKWLVFIITLVLIAWGGSVQAAVQGWCAECHTMHYSQQGKQPGESGFPSTYPYNLWTGTSGPYNALLVDSCIGCHSGSSAIKGTAIPVVLHTSDPTNTGPGSTLAGGDFYWVASSGGADDTKGHNVSGIAGQDSNIGYDPPGWDPNATSGFTWGQVASGASNWTQQLTCAGTYGCHGDHTESTDAGAIRGAHHGDDSCLKAATLNVSAQGSSVTTSYRFLAGIKGIEDSDWEYTATDGTTDHNQYYGVDGNSNYSNKATISYLCAECHGIFHKDTGSSSPWLRHPTDITLPSTTSKEYYAYNGGSGTDNDYDILAPVGSDLSGGVEAKVTPGSSDAIVLCVSCHRAHGSEYPDLLRWCYTTCQAGTSNSNCGCFICHTQKD